MSERVDSPAQYGSKGDPSKDVGGPGEAVSSEEQSQNENDLVRQSWQRYEELRDYKYGQVRPADWRRYALIYGDQHWDVSTFEDWQSTPTINLTFAAIHAILPIITDNRPQIAVVPREPADDQIADVISKVIEWLWEYCDLDLLLPNTMLNTLIFGNGFWKMMWDPNARGGLGDITVVNVDPVNIFFNPEATTIAKATEIYHVEQMPMSWIKAMYPEKADLVREGVQDGNVIVNRPQLPQKGQGRGGEVEIKNTTGTMAYKVPSGATAPVDSPQKKTATVAERWLLDQEKNRWRKIVIANRVLLSDEYTDFDTPPIVHFVDYPVPWTIWASGEVQHVENLQYEINKRRGMMLDILRHCAMPMLVVDPASGVDHETIKAKPNLVIPAEGGPQAVGVLAPQMDLGGLFNVNDRDKQDFNDILGSVDIMLGKNPTGVEAGVALEQLAESANTRLRLKVRLMEGSLRRAGHILLKLIQKHYTTQRIFRIVGNDFQNGVAQAPQFFAINQPTGMQPQMGEDGMPMMGEDGMPAEEPIYGEGSNQIPPDAEFDVRIGAGSTLPVSKAARFQQAITLFDRGAIDQQELLKSAAWPKWEEVLNRMQMQQQQMMMAQQGGQPEAVPPLPSSAEELMGEQPPGQEGGVAA